MAVEKAERIKELTELLSRASRAYYAQDQEIMSNYEYDRLYDELEGLERETGIILAGSPTQHVGYEAVDELPKEAHESPMLSLDGVAGDDLTHFAVAPRHCLCKFSATIGQNNRQSVQFPAQNCRLPLQPGPQFLSILGLVQRKHGRFMRFRAPVKQRDHRPEKRAVHRI